MNYWCFVRWLVQPTQENPTILTLLSPTDRHFLSFPEKKNLRPNHEAVQSAPLNDDNKSQPIHAPATVHTIVHTHCTTMNDNNNDDPRESCVQVAVRIRPLLGVEDESCVQHHQNMIQIGGPSGPRFTFDNVLNCSQQELFDTQIESLVDKCVSGYNATILAYGQTGSGKTHTILGNAPDCQPNDKDAGIIPRAMDSLFQKLNQANNDNNTFSVSLQFLELYGEAIRDLLTTPHTSQNTKLTIRDLGHAEPEVVGATQRDIGTVQEGLQLLSVGLLRRVTGATAMNESSSRSHAIITVHIVQQQTVRTVNDENENESTTTIRSKFSFVDLAGAERQKRTQATGKRLKEGIDINKGLSNLGNVISALGDPKKAGKKTTHVPYRDAKLTRLLKGSLGGNHKTLMIACISPAVCNMGESLNCLRYANRAKNIQNTAVINVDSHTRKLQELQGTVQTLGQCLLQVIDNTDEPPSLSREQVVALLSSGSGGVNTTTTTTTTPVQARSVGSSSNNKAAVLSPSSVSSPSLSVHRLHSQLQESQSHHDAAEQEVVRLKAEQAVTSLLLQNHTPTELERHFEQKALMYEQEIAQLTRTVQEFEQKLTSPLPEWDEEFVTSQEALAKIQRSKLSSIRAALHLGEEAVDDEEDDEEADEQDEHDGDEDHHAEEELASKYIGNLDDSTELDSAQVTKVAEALDELSQNIEAKEKLIDQIKKSKEREAMMRLFYEEKLNELQQTLVERENERDQLVMDLESAKEANTVSEELQTKLSKKQEQINALKKMQQDYRKQTANSTRKTADLNRLGKLQGEVKSMKRRKADMQKELALEKRNHAKELNRLNKMVIQKNREINKIQKASTKHEIEAEKAKNVSKNRLMELSQLKKTLRQYKRGIGLDPVLVGRRQSSHPRKQPSSGNKSAVDVDRVRDYFDKKVANVVRKEALVDKMAIEWEEFFHLNTQLEDLDRNDPDSADTLQNLQVQIQFVNDKIRKTGKRLRQSKAESVEQAEKNEGEGGFLFDKDFRALCQGTAAEASKSAAAKVLFGMVVRERRRVAALAKTASSLDERLQQAERAAEVSDSALRSHMEDHREEVGEINRKHMEHILSLMNMVNNDKPENSESDTLPFDEDNMSTEHVLQKKLLVLSNERVAMLENQLSELQMESRVKEEYRSQLEDVKVTLSTKTEECAYLVQTRNDLRSVLRQIREEASKIGDNGTEVAGLRESIVEMVDRGLHSQSTSLTKNGRLSASGRSSTGGSGDASDRANVIRGVSPRLEKHIEVMHSSDSDGGSTDEDEPEWAESIMNDLALIAEGKVPPSLEESLMDNITIRKKRPKTVFDRLTNPNNFTGTQKARRDADREVIFYEYENSREPDIVSPVNTESTDDLTPTDEANKKSVFDRLTSPSHFTGTQKEKFHETTKSKRDRSAEISADRVLDVLVDGEGNRDAPSEQPAHDQGHLPSDYRQQNVFDRLQKTTTAATAAKQIEVAHQENRGNNHSKGLRSASSTESENTTTKQVNLKQRPDPPAAEEQSSTEEKSPSEDDVTPTSREAYTKQNVFDRLQKTVTQASAVRRSKRLQETRSQDTVSPSNSESTAPAKKANGKRRSDSSNTDESTDTALKTRGSDGSLDATRKKGGNKRGSGDSGADGFRPQNVFERLTKTTTEAYAQKTNRPNH